MGRSHKRADAAAAIAVVSIAGVALWGAGVRISDASARKRSDAFQSEHVPMPKRDAWVGSGACRACHPGEHATWHASFHRTMTQRVSPETVLGAFDGRHLHDGNFEYVVERRGDEFWVRSIEAAWLLKRAFEGPDAVSEPAPASWQRVVMSTGAHNMQMYWVPAGEGNRLIAFPFAWSVEAQRWVPNESTLLRPHEPYVVYGWNDVCIKCHAVAGEPGYDATAPEGERVRTRVAELGIACEACHGPGAEHVARERNPLRRYAHRLASEAGLPEVVNPGRGSAREQSQPCAQCHAASLAPDEDVWLSRGSGYRAGDALSAHVNLVRHPARADQPWIDPTLDVDPDYLSGRFWADGMVRISGRDFTGMRESPCYASEDFGCSTCHSMHGEAVDVVDQLKPAATTNRACVDCHPQLGGDGLAAHTRHPVSSEGSRCVNCHMPHTVYGLTKAIRSHEVSSPSVQESLDYGRPNACNICHLDESLAWTAVELERGWGVAAPPDASEGLDTTPAGIRWLVSGDAGQRALAAWYFGWGPAQARAGSGWMAPWLARALDDDYAAVRWIALRSLRTLPGFESLDWALATPNDDQAAARAAVERVAAQADAGVNQGDDAPLRFSAERHRGLRARRDDRMVDLRE